MTKLREPVTIENKLSEVLGILKIGRAAEATGRQVSYLHSMTDPLKPGQLTVKDVVALDLEWRAAGHAGYPLVDTILRMIEAAAAERFAEEHAYGQLAHSWLKESCEATPLVVEAMHPGATVQIMESALRELEHADGAIAPLSASLKKRIRHAREGPLTPPDG